MSRCQSSSLFAVFVASLAGCIAQDDPAATTPAAVELAAAPAALSPLPLPSRRPVDLVAQPDVSSLAYVSVFGGTGRDEGLGIAADPAGNAYMVGSTPLCSTSTFIFVESSVRSATRSTRSA